MRKTVTEFTALLPAFVFDVGVFRDTPTGIKYRTLSDEAADKVYRLARAWKLRAVSRTDLRTHHREIIVKGLFANQARPVPADR